LGHFAGAGKPRLQYVQARKQIYLPAYCLQLRRLDKELNELAALAKTNALVFQDYATNENVDDTSSPLSHAALVKQAVLAKLQVSG
jgi:hypothetical protein